MFPQNFRENSYFSFPEGYKNWFLNNRARTLQVQTTLHPVGIIVVGFIGNLLWYSVRWSDFGDNDSSWMDPDALRSHCDDERTGQTGCQYPITFSTFTRYEPISTAQEWYSSKYESDESWGRIFVHWRGILFVVDVVVSIIVGLIAGAKFFWSQSLL